MENTVHAGPAMSAKHIQHAVKPNALSFARSNNGSIELYQVSQYYRVNLGCQFAMELNASRRRTASLRSGEGGT